MEREQNKKTVVSIAAPGYVIRYTLDGSVPTRSSDNTWPGTAVYTDPLHISQRTVITAVAYTHTEQSPPASRIILVYDRLQPPVVSPATPEVSLGQAVTLAEVPDPGATVHIYYRICAGAATCVSPLDSLSDSLEYTTGSSIVLATSGITTISAVSMYVPQPGVTADPAEPIKRSSNPVSMTYTVTPQCRAPSFLAQSKRYNGSALISIAPAQNTACLLYFQLSKDGVTGALEPYGSRAGIALSTPGVYRITAVEKKEGLHGLRVSHTHFHGCRPDHHAVDLRPALGRDGCRETGDIQDVALH